MRTSSKARAGTPATYIERVNLAIDYIVAHIPEPLRLADVSRAAMLSPHHFHRVFHMVVGETIADFTKRLRLERAVFMMAHARKPSITQIAFECGFSSSSDFSRSFKQRFGTPPSSFDISAWRQAHGAELESIVHGSAARFHIATIPGRDNPDGFKVKIRELPPRTVAYIRVRNPYRGNAVSNAIERLTSWAEHAGFADNQWLGYQWDNPEITSLDDCQYHVAVEADRFSPAGEIGRFKFPRMTVAQIEIRGGIDLELRALQWAFGSWLPRSGYVPDDHPCFEAWIGRPFAHGAEHFELHAQLPVKRG